MTDLASISPDTVSVLIYQINGNVGETRILSPVYSDSDTVSVAEWGWWDGAWR